jgi:enamine deaminase RidA (YjgF/YER057c/UK114 family)
MRREIRAPGVAEPISHYCDAVEAGGLLFISGWSGATTPSPSAPRC